MTKHKKLKSALMTSLLDKVQPPNIRMVDLIMEEISTAVENAVKAALTDDPLLPHYSAAIREAKTAKMPPDVIASLYAKEQGFKL
jgi:transcriptional regulator of acetoin/glycerol metabolism